MILGPYGCIGKPLALMELRTVIATLVTRFDVDFAPNVIPEEYLLQTKDEFVLHPAELKLVFKPVVSGKSRTR